MPFTSDLLPTYSAQEFCRALKAVRERKGITLDEIATATKVPASLFEGLEHNDLHRWPKGLFRRSFFRDYVRMLDLPVAETCDEFVRLFPEQEGGGALSICATGTDEGHQLNIRLALDAGWHGPRAAILPRILAAFVDCGLVLLAALLIGLWAGMSFWQTAAIVAMVYFSLGTAVLGESPAKWSMAKQVNVLDGLANGRTAIESAFSRGADTMSGVPVEEPHLQVRAKAS